MFFMYNVSIFISPGYWAGGRYDSGSRNWIWFTSKNIIPITSGSTFHAWDPTQPDSSGSQGCIMMLHEFQYFWDDYYCNRKGDFICERSKV
ncbi:hypothetical protein FSP39_008535 [Pinctada imbricata]|uniref:C-type lectin domain-containing protein n=1 Tax=Pinctada imbricata TaxID=66713 RepID=A0AA88YJ42_PINIB|nr:hypothetical protein FSP39_008535 [Pinctada imbricata]